MAATLKPHVRDEYERQAWALRTERCWTEQRIADHLGVSQPAVSLMLKRRERKLGLEFREQAEAIKVRQTATLEHVAAEALTQFQRSCEDATLSRTVDGDKGSSTTAETRGQSGNPALLAQVRGALEDIRSIWGLDAPKQTQQEISGPNGSPLTIQLAGALDKIYGDGDPGAASGSSE